MSILILLVVGLTVFLGGIVRPPLELPASSRWTLRFGRSSTGLFQHLGRALDPRGAVTEPQ